MDTAGNLLVVLVHSADASDAEGARWVLARSRGPWPDLRKGWADQTYRGELVVWARQEYGIDLEIVERAPETTGCVILPRRWVVERTIAWLGRARRLSKEYEHWPDYSETVVYLASSHLLLRRLRPASGTPRPYSRAVA